MENENNDKFEFYHCKNCNHLISTSKIEKSSFKGLDKNLICKIKSNYINEEKEIFMMLFINSKELFKMSIEKKIQFIYQMQKQKTITLCEYCNSEIGELIFDEEFSFIISKFNKDKIKIVSLKPLCKFVNIEEEIKEESNVYFLGTQANIEIYKKLFKINDMIYKEIIINVHENGNIIDVKKNEINLKNKLEQKNYNIINDKIKKLK